jgi:protein SCO1/2
MNLHFPFASPLGFIRCLMLGFACLASVPARASDAKPQYTLVDQEGRSVTNADFQGRYLLVYFGYTNCPDACPTDLQTMAEVLTLLKPEGDLVQGLFISVDPDRDTPAHLKGYAAAFHAKIIGLTGSPLQLEAAARQFGAKFAVPPHKKDDDYHVAHTTKMSLITNQGVLAQSIKSGVSPESIAGIVRRYIRTPQPGDKK